MAGIVKRLLAILLGWLRGVFMSAATRLDRWEHHLTVPVAWDQDPDVPPEAWLKMVREAIPDQPPQAWLDIVAQYRPDVIESGVYDFSYTAPDAPPAPKRVSQPRTRPLVRTTPTIQRRSHARQSKLSPAAHTPSASPITFGTPPQETPPRAWLDAVQHLQSTGRTLPTSNPSTGKPHREPVTSDPVRAHSNAPASKRESNRVSEGAHQPPSFQLRERKTVAQRHQSRHPMSIDSQSAQSNQLAVDKTAPVAQAETSISSSQSAPSHPILKFTERRFILRSAPPKQDVDQLQPIPDPPSLPPDPIRRSQSVRAARWNTSLTPPDPSQANAFGMLPTDPSSQTTDLSEPFINEPASSLFPSLPDDFTTTDESVPSPISQRLDHEHQAALEREMRDRRR